MAPFCPNLPKNLLKMVLNIKRLTLIQLTLPNLILTLLRASIRYKVYNYYLLFKPPKSILNSSGQFIINGATSTPKHLIKNN
jgi:hypothetical protein